MMTLFPKYLQMYMYMSVYIAHVQVNVNIEAHVGVAVDAQVNANVRVYLYEYCMYIWKIWVYACVHVYANRFVLIFMGICIGILISI